MIGDSIRQLRKSKNLTLEDLSNNLNRLYPNTVNFNKGKLSKWENGKEEPKLSSVRILADYFDVTIDSLYNTETGTEISSIETIYNKLEPPRQAKVYNYAEQQLKEQNNVVNLKEDPYKDSIVKHGVDTMAARFADPEKGLPEGVTIEELKAYLEAEAKRRGIESRPD